MAHIEPMDIDSISNDFDDKENLLQNSNVLPRTPSTEKGYEELDVSELNMKLRYSMTPATSPMSRSFTLNCRDSKVCDNENNLMSSMFNDNSNFSHSLNSTITDSILKSSKFPLQVLSTEQFVDDNGNPINRSLDAECNNVTITVNGSDNIDDNLSLPSTSSSLAHTPEATTPTKEIVKDGGSPIMRGLKSVLNMFRSSQSPIPSDDITTNDLNTSECQKKEDISNFTSNMGSIPATTSKSNEKILRTNSSLKESLVFNEDLEKELLWKDETTILFKEEKIPVYKLFFPSNPAAFEGINSKPIERENVNTVEYLDGSFNENLDNKNITEVVKLSYIESETLNSPESDSEFVDCETSYTKSDTGILDDDIPALAPIKKNISAQFSITNENTFQPNEIVDPENSLSLVAGTDLANETCEIISSIHDVIIGANIDKNVNQTCFNDFSRRMEESLDQIEILSNSLKEDQPFNMSDKGNTIVYEDVVECSDETFNLGKYSETIDSQIDKEYKNDIVNTSDIVDNNTTLCGEVKEDDVKGREQITKELEHNYSEELKYNFDSTKVLNELTLETQTGILKTNNIKLPLDSQVVNELDIDLDVAQNMDKNMPLVECEKVVNVNNNCNVKLDSEIIEDTILKEKENNSEIDTYSDQNIQQESKEIETANSSLPSDIPLPYDSDIDKDKLPDINEKKLRENDITVNISSNNTDFDMSYSSESIKHSINGMTSLAGRHSETISYTPISNTSNIQTSHLELSDDISNFKKNMKANESDILKTDINNTDKCIADTKEFSSKIVDSATFPSNNNYSINGVDLDVLKNHTQDSKFTPNLFLQNHDVYVKTTKSTDVEDEIVSKIDVEVQYDDVSLSSTNNKILVTGTELDGLRHDIKDSENPFESKNKLISSLEVQRCDSVMRDVFLHGESIPRDADDFRPKHDEIDIPIVNINTSAIEMDLDVPKYDTKNGKSPIKSRKILTTSLVFPCRDSDVEGIARTKSIESVDAISIDKNDITIKTDDKIEEEVSIPPTFENALVTEMELDVSMLDLEQFKSSPEEQGQESIIEDVNAKKYLDNMSIDGYNEITTSNDSNVNEVKSTSGNKSVTEMQLDISKPILEDSRNPIDTEEKLDSSFEEQGCESVTENANPKKYFENLCLDDFKKLTFNENDFKNNKVITIPTKSNNSLSEIEIDVSKHDLIASENLIKASCRDRDIEDYEIVNNNLKSILIDDPFTANTNSSTSQPNRREILNDPKIFNVAKESANASLDCILKGNIANSCEKNQMNQESYVKDGEKEDYIESDMISPSTSDTLHDDVECNMPRSCSFLGKTEKFDEDAEININNKIPSSSSEIYKSKNVFNLPEINDMNFNPFETNSKVDNNLKTSSDVGFDVLGQINIKSVTFEAEKNHIQDLEPNLSPNLSNITCSSKNTDDITPLPEVHTEDDDTIEGPFLEADDFTDIVKVADFGTEKDMMNFEELPTRINDDNENGELFIDAQAFEFLLNQNKSNVVADSGKESLFLKFDPLFAKRISSDGVLAALNKIQKRQSTPKKPTPLKIMHEENATPGPSTTTPIGLAAPVARDIVEEPVAAMTKPMMVVNPAITSIVPPRKSTTPARANRRSLTFTSPAMAVIDRLLSLSGNSSSLDQNNSLPPSREHNETDFALTQLRELLAEKEIHVHNLRSESKELKERFEILESQVRSLEAESQERLCKVNELNEHLAEKNKINKSMAIVVEEYERTIASLIAEMEQEKKQNAEERMKLISERDEQTAHLASMEVSFSDLHSKYEKSKQIIFSMKANEDTYKKSLNEFEENLLKMQTNYDLLKQHATSKLNHANQELEKYNRTHDAEVLKLNAMIKRKELHITSLEESLSQKTKANEELTAICDELINKVG